MQILSKSYRLYNKVFSRNLDLAQVKTLSLVTVLTINSLTVFDNKLSCFVRQVFNIYTYPRDNKVFSGFHRCYVNISDVEV